MASANSSRSGPPQRCARILVGRGSDVSDPTCLMPLGHAGECEPDGEEALWRLHRIYDETETNEAWALVQTWKGVLRHLGHDRDVDRYDERLDEAASYRGYW